MFNKTKPSTPPPAYEGQPPGESPPPYQDNNWSNMSYIDAVRELISEQTLSDDFLEKNVYKDGNGIPEGIRSLRVNEYTTGCQELVARVTFGNDKVAAQGFCALLVTAYEIGSASHEIVHGTKEPKRATLRENEYSMVLTQGDITIIAKKHGITMPQASVLEPQPGCRLL